MKAIKVKQDFSVNGKFYFAGDTIEEKIKYETLVKINEKGYIEPLTLKELTEYQKELKSRVEEEKRLRNEIDNLNKVRLSKPQSLRDLVEQGNNVLNVDAPIIHPNYAICKGKFASCDVYNIKCVMEGTTCKVSFLVKKTFDIKGEAGTWNPVVHWRLKDEDGVIVKSDRWIAEEMRLGDIKKHTLTFNNITPGKYSIDFIDG